MRRRARARHRDPQDRPYGEQRATARALSGGDLATVRDTWPSPTEWPTLLAEAVARPERWVHWSPGDGAEQAGRLLTALATRYPSQAA